MPSLSAIVRAEVESSAISSMGRWMKVQKFSSS
jgi:hypothetical protein